MIRCTRCLQEKDESLFSKASGRKSGRQPRCKACHKEYASRPDVKKKRAEKYAENRDENIRKCREYYAENRKALLEQKKEYYERNREEILEKTKGNYGRTNARIRERMREDPAYRAASLLRARISHAARTMGVMDKRGVVLRAEREKIKQRIEMNFKPGMSWENYGEWQIDHTKPVAAFVAQGIDVTMANLLCNLRPQWKKDNMVKSSTFKGVTYRFASSRSKNDQDKG